MISVNEPTNDDWKIIKNIYEKSFPVEERREWDDLRRKVIEGIITLYCIRANEQLVGFVTVWNLSNCVYIEHFAIDSSRRGAGIGTQTILNIKDIYSNRALVLEVEHANISPEATRRIEFYKRCGFFSILNFDYIQPPYSIGLPAVPLMLMSTAEIDPYEVSNELHKVVYGVK